MRNYTSAYKELMYNSDEYGIKVTPGTGKFIVDGKEVTANDFMELLRDASEKMDIKERTDIS